MQSIRELLSRVAPRAGERLERVFMEAEKRLRHFECSCDKYGRVWLEIEHAGETMKRFIMCPRLSKDCKRGREFQERLHEMIIDALRVFAPKKHVEALRMVKKSDVVLFIEESWEAFGGSRCMWILSGPAGVGKTFGAVYVIYKMFLHGVGEREGWKDLSKARDYFQSLLRVFLWATAYQLTTFKDISHKAYEVGVLVVDDLGAEEKGASKKAFLYDLINSRYEKELPTIITTNLSMSQIREQYGDRFADRLIEAGLIGEFFIQNMRAEEVVPF